MRAEKLIRKRRILRYIVSDVRPMKSSEKPKRFCKTPYCAFFKASIWVAVAFGSVVPVSPEILRYVASIKTENAGESL